MKKLRLLIGLMCVVPGLLFSASPTTLSVQVLTNGVVYRPTNFWLVNATSIVTAISGSINTNPPQYSFSSDFIVTALTNVALAASNLQGQIDAKSSTASLNTASNFLYTNITVGSLGTVSNSLYTNLSSQINTGTNSVYTNLLGQMTNILGLYNSNVLGGFTLSGITLGTGARTNVAHGLATPPRFLSCVLICRTNDLGYVVGDRIAIDAVESTSDERALLVGCNATNVFLIQRNDPAMKTIDKSTGANSVMDPPSWTATIFAGE